MHLPPQASPPDPPCKRLILAKGVVCDVELCPSCNLFHLNVGATTLRLPPTALRDLAQTLGIALAQYQRVALLIAENAPPSTTPRTDGMH